MPLKYKTSNLKVYKAVVLVLHSVNNNCLSWNLNSCWYLNTISWTGIAPINRDCKDWYRWVLEGIMKRLMSFPDQNIVMTCHSLQRTIWDRDQFIHVHESKNLINDFDCPCRRSGCWRDPTLIILGMGESTSRWRGKRKNLIDSPSLSFDEMRRTPRRWILIGCIVWRRRWTAFRGWHSIGVVYAKRSLLLTASK